MINFIILFIVFLWLFLATIKDFQKKEIDNWINFSLLTFLLSYFLFYSIFNKNLFLFFKTLISLSFFFLLANLFYYARVFGGGDAKLLIALSPIFSFLPTIKENFFISLLFIFILLIVGCIYTFFYTFFIIFKNKKKFIKSLRKRVNILKTSYSIIIPIILFILLFFQKTLEIKIITILLFLFPFLFVYLKSVEECMIFKISVNKLREGDWLSKNIKIKEKIIKSDFRGITKEEILLLKKHKKFVEIKEGVPFTFSFLLSFIIFFYLWFLKQDLFKVFFFLI